MSKLLSGSNFESERIEKLRSYELFDSVPDEGIDQIVQLAAELLAVPIALVSLVDAKRILIKSSVGVGSLQEIERTSGLCASAILSDEIYEIEDALQDDRTLDNPLVTGVPASVFMRRYHSK